MEVVKFVCSEENNGVTAHFFTAIQDLFFPYED